MDKNCNHSKYIRNTPDIPVKWRYMQISSATNELSEIFKSLLEELYEEGGDEHEKL